MPRQLTILMVFLSLAATALLFFAAPPLTRQGHAALPQSLPLLSPHGFMIMERDAGEAEKDSEEDDEKDEQPEDGEEKQQPALPGLGLLDEQEEEAKPQPVILRVSRHQEVAGHIEMEDDNVIVIRTLRDELESFHKTRVHRIVRLVSPEPNQRGVVIMQNGQTREGIVLEDNFDEVIMEIEGIRVRLSRESVNYVRLEPTFEQRYRSFVKQLDPDRHEQHITLVYWLIDQRQYQLASDHLDYLHGVVDEKKIGEIRRLRTLVNAQLELIRNSGRSDDESGDAGSRSGKSGDGSPTPMDARRLLTREEVNLIRVFELDFHHPPRLRVRQDTARRLVDEYSASPLIPDSPSERNRLIRSDALEIVRLMFELRAREFYSEIDVQSDPRAMNMFRQRIHNTWMLNNCATSGCHGGPNETRFMLHRDNYRDERVRYTNFLLLERLDIDPSWPMINYDDPEMSLIIQYGLPREWARLPHPEVPNWKPVFTRKDDRLKAETIAWIEMMMQPRPEYPIEFDPNPQEVPDASDPDEGR